MNTVRTFIALDFPDSAKENIGAFQNRLKQSKVPLKWVNCSNFHLTLKFIGDIGLNQIPAMAEVIKELSVKQPKLEINLSGIGAFPNLKDPMVFWLGVTDRDHNLTSLQKKVDIQLSTLGYSSETKRYFPHLTIARAHNVKEGQILTSYMEQNSNDFSEKITLNTITIFQSQLTPKGPVYTPLAEYLFQG